MNWLNSIVIAVLTALFSALLSGFIAARAVVWYRISSFEGGSGYFVIFTALAAFVGGLVLGLIVARVVANGASPGFAKALGVAWLIVSIVGATVGTTSRLLADVPPRLHGEELMLLVEVRWPASQTVSPATDTTPRIIELGSLSGNTLRTSKQGPLWLEDAHLVDGRWIAPGAVEVFTERGERVLSVEPKLAEIGGVSLPLPAHPGDAELKWSEWLPRPENRAGSPADRITYRYKVIPRSQPSRTQSFGGLEVGTIASAFYNGGSENGHMVIAATATFVVTHHGQSFSLAPDSVHDGAPGAAPSATPADSNSRSASQSNTTTDSNTRSGSPSIATTDSSAHSSGSSNATTSHPPGVAAGEVATVPGTPPALLVTSGQPGLEAGCYLLEDTGARVRSTFVSHCSGSLQAEPLTNDSRWRESTKGLPVVQGRIDRVRFMHPGVYLFRDGIFDAAARTVRKSGDTDYPMGFNRSVPPIGVSPNGLSYVRLGFSETDQNEPALLVFNTTGALPYLVPVNRAATRYPGYDGLDNAWLTHYYEWQPAVEGVERLTVRDGVTPLPHRGIVHIESDGNVVYQVHAATGAMIDAIASFLTREFNAKRTAEDEGNHSYRTHIDGVAVTVFHNESSDEVALFIDRGSDLSLVRRIGVRFNAALATGKYDGMFSYERKGDR